MSRGILAGAVAGAAASLAMNLFQSAWMKSAVGFRKPHGAQSAKQVIEEENPTVKMVRKTASLAGVRIDRKTEERLAVVVHYAFGAAAGAVYGAAAARAGSAGAGALYGIGLWFAADQVMLPALRLSRRPSEYPFWIHLYSLSSHAVYGIALEEVRRRIDRSGRAAAYITAS